MGCSAGLVLAHHSSIGDAATFIYTSKGNRRGCRRTRTRRTAGYGSRLAVARDPLPFSRFSFNSCIQNLLESSRDSICATIFDLRVGFG